MLASLLRYRRRAAESDPHTVHLARPVISIGNVSMGGRGKSPVAGLVARILLEAGERPSILSRGYGRAIADDGVTVVSDGRTVLSDLAHSGDEPLMLARAVPGAAVLVCEQRALAGTLAESAFGCTVHVLDDGFQHHQLHRDIDIVLVTSDDFTGRVMPFGHLREPLDALASADAVVMDGRGAGDDAAWTLVRELGTPAALRERAPVFAVAGIAGPERFFTSLAAAGFVVVGTMGFKDHHRFTSADVQRVSAEASRLGAAAIVTTAKDAVRLEAFTSWPVPLMAVPLDVRVEPADEFRTWLLTRLSEVRA